MTNGRSKNVYDNSRPFDVHTWSEFPEVNRAVDHIFAEIIGLGKIQRVDTPKIKRYVKVLSLDLYVCYVSDPTCYIGYSRNHNAYKIDRYNKLFIKTDLLVKLVDLFIELGYVTNKLGVHYTDYKRQSRMRATKKFMDLILGVYAVKPLMISRHKDTDTIILKDAQKTGIDYVNTIETNMMRENLWTINGLLDKTLINIYLPDSRLMRLKHRMITGEVESDIEHEEARGALNFNRRRLYRVFNNESFGQGGRFYGGWWQGIPKEYRKFIKINNMLTVESDFSGMHINLLYTLKKMELPFSDPYELEGMPKGTRDVVKRSLLTIINAKDRKSALKSIRQEIRDKKITLPKGIKKIEEIITPFEEKHGAIKEFFFSGSGVYLQNIDSQIAERIMLLLEKKGIPALPLHDSFIVSFRQENGLQRIMLQSYREITGYNAKVDGKTSLIDQNKNRPIKELEEEQNRKIQGFQFTDEFKEKYRTYCAIRQEWKEITGRDNIFVYNPQAIFNRETYD